LSPIRQGAEELPDLPVSYFIPRDTHFPHYIQGADLP
jgi:hypothetical protein